MRTEQPKMIYLKDYQAPDYLIDETHLTFELFEDHSLVHAQLVMRRNPERGAGLPPLVLDGQQLELLSVNLADQELTADDYQLTDSPVTNTKQRITYKELLTEVEIFAGVLRQEGVKKGDVVLVYSKFIIHNSSHLINRN